MRVNTKMKDFANTDTGLRNVLSREYGENLFRMDVSRNIMIPCCGWDKLCLSKIFLISKIIAVSGQRSIVSYLCKGKQRKFPFASLAQLEILPAGAGESSPSWKPWRILIWPPFGVQDDTLFCLFQFAFSKISHHSHWNEHRAWWSVASLVLSHLQGGDENAFLCFLVYGCTNYCILVDIAATGTDKDILVPLLLSWGVFLSSSAILDRFGSLCYTCISVLRMRAPFLHRMPNDLHRGFDSAWSVPCAP